MAIDMPAAEADVDVDLVRRLIADQRPDLSNLAIVHVAYGWDNVSFRVGEDLVARLPRRALAAALIENEVRWLPELAPFLSLPVPVPVFVGEPGQGYPWRWTIVPWIPGDSAAIASIDYGLAPTALAAFLRSLHVPAPDQAPANPFRAVSLRQRDHSVSEWIGTLSDVIDHERVSEVWEDVLALPEPGGSKHWIHADLHPHNILVDDRVISGVIDFGDLCGGDPATDLAVAWIMFSPRPRRAFRDAYGGDVAVWRRARGWALLFSLAYLANSADNPTMSRLGRTGLASVLADI